jgi:hypothetical protein
VLLALAIMMMIVSSEIRRRGQAALTNNKKNKKKNPSQSEIGGGSSLAGGSAHFAPRRRGGGKARARHAESGLRRAHSRQGSRKYELYCKSSRGRIATTMDEDAQERSAAMPRKRQKIFLKFPAGMIRGPESWDCLQSCERFVEGSNAKARISPRRFSFGFRCRSASLLRRGESLWLLLFRGSHTLA